MLGAEQNSGFAVLRKNDVAPKVRFIRPTGQRVTQHGLRLGTHVGVLHGGHVHFPDDGIDAFHQMAKTMPEYTR